MKRSGYTWPTGPIRRKKEKVKRLLNKLEKAANDNKDKSTEINNLKDDIKNLTNID